MVVGGRVCSGSRKSNEGRVALDVDVNVFMGTLLEGIYDIDDECSDDIYDSPLHTIQLYIILHTF